MKESKSKSIRIRRARRSDMTTIKRLVREHPKELMQERLPSPSLSFVAVNDSGQAVGFCGLDPSQTGMAELRTLVVDKNYRRMGIAGRLVSACEQLAVQKGISQLFAVTGAKEFFHKAGYKPLPPRQITLFKHLKRKKK